MSETEVITGEAPLRYAQALLELAEDAKSLSAIEKDVKSLRAMFKDSADLSALINSPVFATEDKVEALTSVAKKAKLKPLTVQFVGLVAENRRSEDLPKILSAFEEMVARRKGSQVAKVTSAKKLTAAQVTSLKSNLKKSLGRPVEVETSVDADLLGGFVVRVGSRLYDSSLKTKLEDLRLTLKEA